MHQLQRIQWKFWHSLPKPSWGCRNHHQCAKDVISDIVQSHGSLSFLWSQSWGFVLSNPCFECCLHKAFGMYPQILSLRFKYQIFAKNIFFALVCTTLDTVIFFCSVLMDYLFLPLSQHLWPLAQSVPFALFNGFYWLSMIEELYNIH